MTFIFLISALGVGWSIGEQISVRRLKEFVAAGGSISRADGVALSDEEIAREFVSFRSVDQHRFFRVVFIVVGLTMALTVAYVMWKYM